MRCYFHVKINIHFWSYLAHFFLEWEMSQKEFCKKSEHSLYVQYPFPPPPLSLNSCRLWSNAEKYCRAGRPTDGNMTHAQCVLETKGYIHTLTICNTYWFSTTTMVAPSRLITLYVNILACVFAFFLLGACAKSSCLSFCPRARARVCVCGGGVVVHMEQLGSQWTNSHMKFDIWVSFENLPRNLRLH